MVNLKIKPDDTLIVEHYTIKRGEKLVNKLTHARVDDIDGKSILCMVDCGSFFQRITFDKKTGYDNTRDSCLLIEMVNPKTKPDAYSLAIIHFKNNINYGTGQEETEIGYYSFLRKEWLIPYESLSNNGITFKIIPEKNILYWCYLTPTQKCKIFGASTKRLLNFTVMDYEKIILDNVKYKLIF